eukprot:scaffold64898_cov33-Phaeocystis_antarctica.AAC.2
MVPRRYVHVQDAQWSCRNRHQGEGPPERAHTGPGRPKPPDIACSVGSTPLGLAVGRSYLISLSHLRVVTFGGGIVDDP